jgi:hypothetical protein
MPAIGCGFLNTYFGIFFTKNDCNMNTNKFLIGGIIGGIAYFLLGWLIYGMLLMESMKSPIAGVDRAPEEMVLWALILGNLLTGFLLSYIFSKSGVASIAAGITTGAVTGLLMSSSYDFVMYGVTNLFGTGFKLLLMDVAVFTVISGIVGAVIGWYNGMGKK